MKLFDSFKRKERKAFTLVEVLVVVAILGILFIVLMASVNWSTDTARESGVHNDLRSYQTAANAVGLEAAGFPDDVKTLSTMLNKRLDPNMAINVTDGTLVTVKEDPWGTLYRIGYNRPAGSKGQLTFTSAGPNTIFDDADDIITVIRYEVGEGQRGQIVIENPKNDEFHTHVYDRRVVDAKYLYQTATCSKVAKYYESCSCGAMGTTLFEDGTVDLSSHGKTTFTYTQIASNLVNHNVLEVCEDCGTEVANTTELHVKRETPLGTICDKCEMSIHSHTYDNIVADKYLKISATCERNAVYYQSCTCGQVSDGTFEAENSRLQHQYTAQLTDAAFLITPGDCVTEDTYVKSCIYCRQRDPNTNNSFTSGGYRSENHKVGAGYNYSSVSKNSQYHMLIAYCAACNVAVNEQELAHRFDSANNCADCNYHEHHFTNQNPDNKFVKEPATCTTSATYFYSCSCGQKGTETFDYGYAKGHTFAERAVASCLKNPATCGTYAEYYKSCSVAGCSAVDTETFFDTLAGYDRAVHTPESEWIVTYNTKDMNEHTVERFCNRCNNSMGRFNQSHTNGTTSCSLCNMHRHDFTAQVVSPEFLAASKSCTSYAKYYRSCSDPSCNEFSTTTFDDVDGGLGAHNFVERIGDEYIYTVATCLKAQSYYKSCSECGVSTETTASPETFTYGEKDLNNHTGTKVTMTQQNLCLQYTCCGEQVTTHTYKLTNETAATCTANGSKVYTCDVCSYSYTETIETGGHMWVAATCNLPKTCAKCNEHDGNALGHIEHTNVAKRATCLTAGYCGRCEQQVFAALGHEHPMVAGSPAQPTCTEPVICGRTGCNVQLVAATGHNASGALASCQSAQICANVGCNVELSPRIQHVYNIDAPTCTKAKYCVMCYNVQHPAYPAEYAQPALGHEYNMSVQTCTSAAQCLRCKLYADYNDPNYGALKHDLINHPHVYPTCTEVGSTEWNECSRCDYRTNKEVIPALGHANVTDYEVPATCTETGLDEGVHCTRDGCGYVVEQSIKLALGHNYPDRTGIDCTTIFTCQRVGCTATDGPYEHVEAYAPTCTKGSICGICKVDMRPANGHTGVSATCTEPWYCSVCNIQEPSTILGHNWETTMQPTAATCTTAGNTAQIVCSRCRTIRQAATTLPALGHNYSVAFDWDCTGAFGEPTLGLTFTDPATCEATGECQRCHDIFSVDIPATAIETRAQSCTENPEWVHRIDLNVISGSVTEEQFQSIQEWIDAYDTQCSAVHTLSTQPNGEHEWVDFEILDYSCQTVNLTYRCSVCLRRVTHAGQSVKEIIREETCTTAGLYRNRIAFGSVSITGTLTAEEVNEKYLALNGDSYCPCHTTHGIPKLYHLIEITSSLQVRTTGQTSGSHSYKVDPSVPYEMYFSGRCLNSGCSMSSTRTFVIKQRNGGTTQVTCNTVQRLTCTTAQKQYFIVNSSFVVEGFDGAFSNHAKFSTNSTTQKYFSNGRLRCCESHVSQAATDHSYTVTHSSFSGYSLSSDHKEATETFNYTVTCGNAHCNIGTETGSYTITKTTGLTVVCNKDPGTYKMSVSNFKTPKFQYNFGTQSCGHNHDQQLAHLENPTYIEQPSGTTKYHWVTFLCDRNGCNNGGISKQYSAPHYNEFPIYWYFVEYPQGEMHTTHPSWYTAKVGDQRDYYLDKYEYQYIGTELGFIPVYDWVLIGHSDFYYWMEAWTTNFDKRMEQMATLHDGKNPEMASLFRSYKGRFNNYVSSDALMNEIEAWRHVQGKLEEEGTSLDKLDSIWCVNCKKFMQVGISLNMDFTPATSFDDMSLFNMKYLYNNDYHPFYSNVAFDNNIEENRTDWFVRTNSYFTPETGWGYSP